MSSLDYKVLGETLLLALMHWVWLLYLGNTQETNKQNNNKVTEVVNVLSFLLLLKMNGIIKFTAGYVQIKRKTQHSATNPRKN